MATVGEGVPSIVGEVPAPGMIGFNLARADNAMNVYYKSLEAMKRRKGNVIA